MAIAVKVRINHRGFTLIELMVVIVIIGIVASMVVVNINPISPYKQLQQQSLRINRLLELANEETLLLSKQIAIEIFSDGYLFYQWQDQQWQVWQQDLIFKRHNLPQPVTMQLLLPDEGIEATLSAMPEAKDFVGEPQLYLFSSGEISAFTLVLNHQELQDVSFEVVSLGFKTEVNEIQAD